MEIIDQGTVFEGAKGSSAQSAAFSGHCVLPSGRILCGFRLAPNKQPMAGQRVALCISDDEGKSWSQPVEPFTPPAIDSRPGLFRAIGLTPIGGNTVLAVLCWVDFSDPSLPFFNEDTEGLLDTRVFISRSEDGGESWSEPALVDTSPFNVPTAITGPILKLADGRLACQFELNKHYYDQAEWHHKSVLMFSRDDGMTWPEHSIASSDPANRIFYWDQRPAVLANDSLLDLFWTFDRKEAVYLNIHARSSADNGKTWTEMWDTGVAGQPAPAVSLPGGRIGMVYVDRTDEPVIKMRTSADGGRNWGADAEIEISSGRQSQTRDKTSMQDAWAEMAAFSIGLPTTALMPGGDVLVTYYSGPETDHTGIRWARIRD